MKIKSVFLLCLLSSSLLTAQTIKIQTGETNVKTDVRPVISKVINNKIYVVTFLDNKATITAFEKETMKQTLSFSTEKLKYIVNSGVLFLENTIVVIYNKKGVFGDVYDYNGKSISKGTSLASFEYENSYNYYSGDCMSSENGKYFMVSRSNQDGKAAFDHVIYDSNLKLISKGNVKLPKDYTDGYIRKLLLSNTATIGILGYTGSETPKFSLLMYSKASKTVEETKVFSEEYLAGKSKVITTKNGIYIGGIYGSDYKVKLKLQGEVYHRMIEGAYAIKLNLDDLSVSYSNLTPFSEEQVEAYNNEMLKHPNFTKSLENSGTPDGKIYNNPLELTVDAMTIDNNDNIVLALSSFNGVSEYYKFATNIVVCQFKLKKEGSMSNFKIIPKRNTSYNDPVENGFRNSDYFFSSLVCSGNYIISIFNDDEKNISNLTDMNKNISGADKKSLLADAEVKSDGTLKKYSLLPQDPDVLIMTYCTLYIDSTLTFAIATRDKGEVVLLKISSLE